MGHYEVTPFEAEAQLGQQYFFGLFVGLMIVIGILASKHRTRSREMLTNWIMDLFASYSIAVLPGLVISNSLERRSQDAYVWLITFISFPLWLFVVVVYVIVRNWSIHRPFSDKVLLVLISLAICLTAAAFASLPQLYLIDKWTDKW